MTILSVTGRPYSQHRPAYMRAKSEFVQSHGAALGRSDFWEKFGKSIGAKIIIAEWFGDIPKVTGLEFNDDKALAWFLLKYT